ncbi:hypothetical protein H1R20_g8893, partial [Candolleomyces eurysporus]
MKKAIYIIGPSSTGKTTLCDALAKRLGLESAAYVKEVARRVMREKGYSRDTVGNLQMQLDIMEAHSNEEEKALEAANLVLCDRSAIDPIAYAILTSSNAEEARQRKEALVGRLAFKAALERYRDHHSVFILLSPVQAWLIDDGVRSLENQEACMDVFRKVLKDLEIPYRVFGPDCQFLFERLMLTLGYVSM